jgi:hypothetical protein
LIALGGSTDNVTIDNVICQAPVTAVLQLGGNTGAGNITYDNIICPTYTTFRADTGDKLGKFISSFSAYLASNASNVTGDGSFYTPSGWTELYDNGGIFDASTGQVIAKVAGWYRFDLLADFNGVLSGHTDANVLISVQTTGNFHQHGNIFAMASSGNGAMSCSADVYLIVGQAVNPTVMVSGAAKVVGLNSAITGTRFSGRLIKQG